MKKKRSLTTVIIICLVLLNIIIFTNNTLFDLFNLYSMLIIPILLFCLFIYEGKIFRNEIKLIVFLIIFTLYGLFSIIFVNGSIGSVYTIIHSILIVILLKRTMLDVQLRTILLIIFLIINLIIAINSPGYYLKALYDKTNNINSNSIAIFLLISFMYIYLLSNDLFNYKSLDACLLILLVVNIWATTNLQARSSTFVLILFYILNSFKFIRNLFRRRLFTLIVVFIIILFGVIFPYYYASAFSQGNEVNVLFLNKKIFSGRELIWVNFFSEITGSGMNLILGVGSKAELWTGKYLNLHNNFLAILANFGVIGFILYYSFIISEINDQFKYGLRDGAEGYIIAFICLLLNGYLEVTTLWSTIYFIVFLLLELTKKTNETRREELI